jgi:hypothetical protein
VARQLALFFLLEQQLFQLPFSGLIAAETKAGATAAHPRSGDLALISNA